MRKLTNKSCLIWESMVLKIEKGQGITRKFGLYSYTRAGLPVTIFANSGFGVGEWRLIHGVAPASQPRFRVQNHFVVRAWRVSSDGIDDRIEFINFSPARC